MHLAWHRCLDAYSEPDAFSIEINTAIQAARNVTFALQKELAHTDGFEEWYAVWREVLRKDPISRWSLNARNKIVKSGDLETRSTTRAWLLESYHAVAGFLSSDFSEGEGPEITQIEAGSLDSIAFLEDRALKDMPNGNPNSALAVERRWEDEDLPNWELLDALGHCFGLLACLAADADVQFSDARVKEGRDWFAPEMIGTDGWPMPEGAKPPCMVTSQSERTTILRLGTSKDPIGKGVTSLVSSDGSSADRAVLRYGVPIERPENPKSPLDFIDSFAKMVKVVLEKDRRHAWSVMYFRGPSLLSTERLEARDRADKYQIYLHVAETARKLRANGVLEMGEIWISDAPLEGEPVPTDASLGKNRREGVSITALTASGESRCVVVFFERSAFGIVSVGDTVDFTDLVSNSFSPLIEVWERQPSLYS